MSMQYETNVAGGLFPVAPGLCTGCQLARMMEAGTIVTTVNNGHSQCEGTLESPCSCGCDYALHRQCKECGRRLPGEALDPSGQCTDRRDCANHILAAAASRRAERASRAVEKGPTRASRPTGGPKPDCGCGCGEKTGGGTFRPGHDARMVSNLTRAVRAGELTASAASDRLPSQKLRDKLAKALS